MLGYLLGDEKNLSTIVWSIFIGLDWVFIRLEKKGLDPQKDLLSLQVVFLSNDRPVFGAFLGLQ